MPQKTVYLLGDDQFALGASEVRSLGEIVLFLVDVQGLEIGAAMGYGGALIWTAVARNLKAQAPYKKVICVCRNTWQRFLTGRPLPDAEVYRNNPDISFFIDSRIWPLIRPFFSPQRYAILDMTDPRMVYWEEDSEVRVVYKKGRHAIQIACDALGISDAQLKPRIVFGPEELLKVDKLLVECGLEKGRYICLEPQANFSFSPNKEWFWDRWQELVDKLDKALRPEGIRIVQIGKKGRVLGGVIDLTGRTTFREAGVVLERAITFIGYIGGLVHLAKSVGKKNIVLVSGFEPLELASYPDDVNFYVPLDCSGCGLKVPCPRERECMRKIPVGDVVRKVLEVLA